MPDQEQGREGFKRFLGTTLYAASPDLQWARQSNDSGDMQRHSARRIFGHSPTHTRAAVSAWVIDRVVQGKMIESRLLMGAADMLQQLGIFPHIPAWCCAYWFT